MQFLSWPDHSTPEVEDYCHFLEEYRVHRDLSEKKNISCAPIVVHCTAGLGRTGTFIAIEILLDHIQNCFSSTNLSQASFNPGALVYELRKHRNKMVQTLSQYEFIYSFLRYCFVNRKLLMFPHQSPTSSELNYSSRRRSSSKRIRTTRDVDKRMFAFESSESDVKPCSGAGDRRPSRQSISRFRFSVDGTDN